MASDVVVLDTNVWSHLFGFKRRQHDQTETWRRLLTGRTIAIATQTRAEILVWPLSSNLGETRTNRVLAELDATPTIPVDEQVIQRYARLTVDATKRGDALCGKAHVGDRWIAATALAINASLLSDDQIFRHDPDLVLLGRDAS